MAKPKNVTIKLTAKQRYELKRLTGADHSEVMFESVTPHAGAVASRATLSGKSAPKKGVHFSAPRKIKVGLPRKVNPSRPRPTTPGVRPRGTVLGKGN